MLEVNASVKDVKGEDAGVLAFFDRRAGQGVTAGTRHRVGCSMVTEGLLCEWAEGRAKVTHSQLSLVAVYNFRLME